MNRLRVKYIGGGKWVAVALDEKGSELERSPEGSEVEAEGYMDNYRRYGAWRKS